jgi:solute carrier family 45 protein 1/2/4
MFIVFARSYGFGFIRLAQLPVVSWIGGSQFRKFCIICIAFLVSTVAVTCYFHEEQERPELKGIKRRCPISSQRREQMLKGGSSPMKEMVMNIYYSALRLPVSIQRVCITQLFAFMGWWSRLRLPYSVAAHCHFCRFPFLFYATTYIGQVMAAQIGHEPDPEYATRRGDLALLLNSLSKSFHPL